MIDGIVISKNKFYNFSLDFMHVSTSQNFSYSFIFQVKVESYESLRVILYHKVNENQDTMNRGQNFGVLFECSRRNSPRMI